mmetsp:Transcript_96482/g.241988  ORF Transcript_96482/g.241988 Transcript_96482/m.241988 type:complete len:301 (+) Transcript_96482:1266-2168(+)
MDLERQTLLSGSHRAIPKDEAVRTQLLWLAPYRGIAAVDEQAVILQPLREEGKLRLRPGALSQVLWYAFIVDSMLVAANVLAQEIADVLEALPRALYDLLSLRGPEPHGEALAQREGNAEDVGVPSDHKDPKHKEVHENRTISPLIRLHGVRLSYVLEPHHLAHAAVVPDVLARRPGDRHLRHPLQHHAAICAQDILPVVARELEEATGRTDYRAVDTQGVNQECSVLAFLQQVADCPVSLLHPLQRFDWVADNWMPRQFGHRGAKTTAALEAAPRTWPRPRFRRRRADALAPAPWRCRA